MATNTLFLRKFQDTLLKTLKDTVQEIAEEEIQQAKSRIDRKVKDEIDKIALRIFNEYRLEDGGTHLSIHVRKDFLKM